MSVAITGSPVEISRAALESLVRFFGGGVAKAVGRTTTTLVVGSWSRAGRGVEQTVKYTAARELGVRIVRAGAFLEEIQQGAGGGGPTATFAYDAGSQDSGAGAE